MAGSEYNIVHVLSSKQRARYNSSSRVPRYGLPIHTTGKCQYYSLLASIQKISYTIVYQLVYRKYPIL